MASPAAARVLLDASASHSSLWGDVQVKLVGSDNSTVTTSCTVDPIPNVRDLFYNHGAARQQLLRFRAAAHAPAPAHAMWRAAGSGRAAGTARPGPWARARPERRSSRIAASWPRAAPTVLLHVRHRTALTARPAARRGPQS